MRELGVMLPDELADFDLATTISIAECADREGYHSVWKGETSGTNGFMTLSAIAQRTNSVRLGTGIANVFSRSPTLIGMSALTLDELSNGRAMVGLGTSSPEIVGEWHGMAYERPLRRVHETIDITRSILDGGMLEYEGELFDLGPYPVDTEPAQGSVPIYNAALGPANRRLTGQFADGWMPVLTPKSEFPSRAEDVRHAAASADRDPDSITIAPWVPLAVSSDPATAEQRMRWLLAQEMAMGYDDLFAQKKYSSAATEARLQWKGGDRDAATEAISDAMLADLTVFGTAEDCRAELEGYFDRGADLPILWPSFAATADEVRSLLVKLANVA